MVKTFMVLLLLLCLVIPVVQSQEVTPAQMRERMRQIVTVQAKVYDMPPQLLVEMCRKESDLQYDAKGLDASIRKKPRYKRTLSDYSYGLCQVKLSTARWVWSRMVPLSQQRMDIEVWHLSDPVFNSATAAILMMWLKTRFGDWRLALAAYNSGPYDLTDPANPRLKTPAQLSTGKGSYSMMIWMRWQVARLKPLFESSSGRGQDYVSITLANRVDVEVGIIK